MLCRSCLRAAIRRQGASSSASLQTTFPALRMSTAASLSQISRPTITPRGSLSLAQRPYSTSPATQPSSTSSSSAPSALEKPDFLDEAESTIWDMLVAEFSPKELVVQDISGGCGSMYGIEISSEKFRGANMLKQQRMVNAVLGDLMKGWHGVQLKTRVP